MYTASVVYTIIEGFPIPSLLKNVGKTNYTSIKDTHQLLIVNAESAKRNLGGGQNGNLGLALPPDQYNRISNTPFVRPPDPGIMKTVPKWTTPGEEKRLL